jgi:gamma-glutamylcyclotransferase (GGCT)/AIG2-like uncharacterized protein YtfP
MHPDGSNPTAKERPAMTSSEHLPFFVYGTLRPGGRHHAWALHGRTTAEEPARLPGARLYEGPGFPYAVAAPREAGAEVRGELVHPAPERYEEVLATLDRLESRYRRVAVRVLRRDDSPARAWVYLASGPLAARLRASGTPIPGGEWRGG